MLSSYVDYNGLRWGIAEPQGGKVARSGPGCVWRNSYTQSCEVILVHCGAGKCRSEHLQMVRNVCGSVGARAWLGWHAVRVSGINKGFRTRGYGRGAASWLLRKVANHRSFSSYGLTVPRAGC